MVMGTPENQAGDGTGDFMEGRLRVSRTSDKETSSVVSGQQCAESGIQPKGCGSLWQFGD